MVPAVQAPPIKKSRYTRKDDILLAKHFAQLDAADKQEKKTSDVLFQEFANLVSLSLVVTIAAFNLL